ncbi:MAG TPA: glycosyltransferase family 2 protein [Methanobacterium sp.]|jgi:rhamnosyltransferase|nr:glycosyltransferase [Methanobacterium sp.]HOI40058.1 glycosyltransferase family 2 protein [Methanobacterium sp.]
MTFDLSIILLIKNGGRRLELLMESLERQKFSGSFEIIAIDSGSKDGSLEILEKYNTRIFRIKPEEFHHSRTRNLGAEKSKGEVLVYLTQDALPINNDLLEKLVNPLKDPEVAVSYGRQIANPDAADVNKFFYSYFYPDEKKVLSKEVANNPKKFYINYIYVSDVCSAIKKEVWDEVRFTDDVPMSEDKDFALKVLKAGYGIVYEPEATVYHSHDYSLHSLFKRRFQDGSAFSNIALEGESGFFGRGFKFVTEEMKFLVREKKFLGIPYAIIYNFIDFLGFFLGKHEKYIPGFIK